MASELKSELEELKQNFPKNHERFRILNHRGDELTCRFIGKNEKFYDIQANITDAYPSFPPIWCTEVDEPIIENALETLVNTKGRDNHITNQVRILLRELCRRYDVPLPADLNSFMSGNGDELVSTEHQIVKIDSHSDKHSGNDDISDVESLASNAEYKNDVDMDMEMELEDSATETPGDDAEVKIAEIEKRQFQLQFDGKARGSQNFGSNLILKKELQSIFRSDAHKNKIFSVDLIDDCLYNWNVNLLTVDPESPLHNDLILLKKSGGRDRIEMNITFKESYPNEPPFVLVSYPAIKGGHVLAGGALCMELLTSKGWNIVYSVEAVIMQIASTLVTGGARVDFQLTKVLDSKPYTLSKALEMFAYHEKLHEKIGWVTPSPKNG